MFRRTVKCKECGEKLELTENVKYITCDYCEHTFLNKRFKEPSFHELEFSEFFSVANIPSSTYNIAIELMKKINQIELCGKTQCIVYFSEKVCESKNEVVLLSNLTHMNCAEQTAEIDFKYAFCSNHTQTCDYSYACPIQVAAYLYLVRENMGEAYIKEQRKLAKKNSVLNDAKKSFDWNVNNHTSEYIPTKVLKFIEKLLDLNYISFSTTSFRDNEYVIYTTSKHLLENNIDYLMSLSQKELRTLLTTDLVTNTSFMSFIGTVQPYNIPHLAKYVEYLRRNGSYIQFYKKQLKTEKARKKLEGNT